MSWQTRVMLLIVGALVAGQALHWFVGGASATHSNLRNGLVVVQFAIGASLLVLTWRGAARIPQRD